MFAIMLLSTVACFAQKVKYDEWKNLTTSGKLPKECKIQHSNNNLDLVKFKDRYYLVFRTAPTHYASKKTVLYVISSPDLDNWVFETEIKPGRDAREPRFAVFHDTLNLYYFTASANIFKFDPHEMLMLRTVGNKEWTKPQSVHLDGFVPWRVRERSDTLFLSAYYGKHLYKKDHKSDLRLFSSVNAKDWTRISQEPQISLMNAEEGEFIFDKQGDLFSTVRLEGTGAMVCKADRCCINKWDGVRTKYKYDSAMMFEHGEDIYMVSRKNNDGEMDKLKDRKDENKGRVRNLVRYWFTTKVTALFKLDKKNLTLSEVVDFPSTGDCSFPAISKLDDKTYVLMNYSSNIKGRKKNWFFGQLGKTYIYWTKLRFEE